MNHELTPFDIPAAWCGEELLQRDDWLVELTEIECDEIIQAVQNQQRDENGMPNLQQRFSIIRDNLEKASGSTMIRGFPIEQLSAAESELAFSMLTAMLGTAVSQNVNGDRIFHVRDEGFAENDPRARGPNTKKRLSFHTDRCDVIGFLCLQQAVSGGENELVSSVTLYNQMLHTRPDLANVLMQPFYYKRHNVDLGNDLPYCQQPIFSIYQGQFAANFLRVLIQRAHEMPEVPPLSDLQIEAMDYLEELAESPEAHVRFRQQPGDMLFVNNWVTLHRRTEFEDHPEPELRRHLLRVWLSMPNSRELDPRFAANYGSTQAGAIRGGMRAKFDL